MGYLEPDSAEPIKRKSNKLFDLSAQGGKLSDIRMESCAAVSLAPLSGAHSPEAELPIRLPIGLQLDKLPHWLGRKQFVTQ